MDHSEAIKSKATERYLLGELTLKEREAFEEHYFECQECAADVKSAAIFVDNAQEVLRKQPAASVLWEPKRAWWQWFINFRPAYALAASLLFVAILGYQNLVTIPRLRNEANTPQALPSFSLLTSGSRSESVPAFTVERNGPFGLYVDIPATRPFDHYLCEVQAQNGNTKFSVKITAEQARNTVQLFIPGAVLEAGRYNLVVLGSTTQSLQKPAGEEVARYQFAIQTK